MAKVILSVAMSSDGYIADKNGSIDWLSCMHESDTDYGFVKFLRSIHIIVMGKNAYNEMVALGDWPFAEKKTYVFMDKIDQDKRAIDKNIIFFIGTVQDCIKTINTENLRANIWLYGGAQIIQSFYTAGVIDEYILTIVPVVLGTGLALPEDIVQAKGLTEVTTKMFKDGVKQVHLLRS